MSKVVDIWIKELIAARENAQRIVPTVDRPSTAAEAYQIQAGVAQHVGDVGAFKTARKTGAAPIMAPIFAGDIIPSGSDIGVKDVMGIELEVGFQIVKDCPENLADMSLDELAKLLRPVAVIELVDTRLTDAFAEDAIAKLADNQINAGLVIGTPLTDWDGTDFGTVEAKMAAGEDILIDGEAMVPGGSALETFASLARLIGNHCGGLQRGQIVITGSLHPLVYYPAGTVVSGEIAGIGAVSVTLGAA